MVDIELRKQKIEVAFAVQQHLSTSPHKFDEFPSYSQACFLDARGIKSTGGTTATLNQLGDHEIASVQHC